jgi:hypothetical protein
MLSQSSVRSRRRIRLGLALVLVTVGGAAAVWNQTRIKFSTAPMVRIAGRVSTRVPGVRVGGLRVQLVKGDFKHPPGPLLGLGWTETDAAGSFELAGELPAMCQGKAEIYIHSPPADDTWTYRPAVVALEPGRRVEGVELELLEGVEVEGRFVDADSDNPVTPVKLAIIGSGRLSFLGTMAPIRETDMHGVFRVRLNPGNAEVVAFNLPAAYAKAYTRGFRQTVEIPVGSQSFTLPPLRLRRPERATDAR